MIIDCRECGGKVSTEAKTCTHCGCPVKTKDSSNIYCDKCGKEFSLKESSCPHCGKYNFKAADAVIEEYNRKHVLKWTWGGVDLT